MIKELDQRQLQACYAIEGAAHVRDALMLKANLGGTPVWDETADDLLICAMCNGDNLEKLPFFLADIYVGVTAHAVALLALHLAGGDHDGAQVLLRDVSAYRAADHQR